MILIKEPVNGEIKQRTMRFISLLYILYMRKRGYNSREAINTLAYKTFQHLQVALSPAQTQTLPQESLCKALTSFYLASINMAATC